MIFKNSPCPDGTVTVNHHPCPHEFAGLISLTGVTATIGPFGYYLQQQEEAIDTIITKQHFHLHGVAPLEFTTGKPVIVLCYVISGTIRMVQPGYEDILFEEGTYHMQYLPAGKHQVQMQTGTCTLLHIELSQPKVKMLTKHFPSLLPLVELAQDYSLDYLRLPTEKTNADIDRIIKCIRKSNDGAPFRQLSMEIYVIELLRNYVHDLIQHKKYNLSNYHYTEEELEKIKQATVAMTQDGYRRLTVKQIFEDRFNIPLHKAMPGVKMLFHKDARTIRGEGLVALACDLLIHTDKTVEQIALELDYENGSGLNKPFKKYKGCTPTEFREMHRRGKPGADPV